jgi:hypothetical protein
LSGNRLINQNKPINQGFFKDFLINYEQLIDILHQFSH